ELVHDVAFRPADFGRGEPAEAGYDVEAHVAAARARVEAWVASELRVATSALLAEHALLTNLTVSGPASTARYALFCELLDRVRGGAVPDADWAAAYCEVTSFTAGARKDPNI